MDEQPPQADDAAWLDDTNRRFNPCPNCQRPSYGGPGAYPRVHPERCYHCDDVWEDEGGCEESERRRLERMHPSRHPPGVNLEPWPAATGVSETDMENDIDSDHVGKVCGEAAAEAGSLVGPLARMAADPSLELLWLARNRLSYISALIDGIEQTSNLLGAKRDCVSTPGGDVVLLGSWFTCTRCGILKPGSLIGLRTMDDGTVRNQPQCSECRSMSNDDREIEREAK